MKIDVEFPGGAQVNAKVGNFTIITDQPKAAGGMGSAPSPFEVFLASIATCAGYFATAFCKERDISTEGMKLTAEFNRNPETRVLDDIKIHLTLPPGFPEKYVKPIIRTMEQCSVKKAIMAQPKFELSAS